MQATLWEGNETLEVVGESHYQEELWRVVGVRPGREVRTEIVAILSPEPTNRFDPNAIKVSIHGLTVGFLAREQAKLYGPGVRDLMAKSTNGLVALAGMVVGGGSGRDSLGVFLDHDPADFGLAPAERSAAESAGFRTGLSEAFATDAEDDSYDLSWMETLSYNSPQRIKQLRSLLEKDPDPIDRHFMFCNLEQELYQHRDGFASALTEFDEACHQHDAEMNTIRPALLNKFGRLPYLDLYKQSAIRHNKAKDWERSLWWAERGLHIYGEDAGVPGVMEDLQKRADYARTKLSTPARTPKPKAVAGSPIELGADGLEELTCKTCNATFERLRTRGRKPHECPTCRGSGNDVDEN